MQSDHPTPTSRWSMAAVTFAMLLPTATAAWYFVALSGQRSMQGAFVASKVLQFVFPLVWVLAYERALPRAGRPSRSGMVYSALFGMMIGVGIFALYYGGLKTSPLLVGAPERLAEKMAGFGVDTATAFLAMAAFYTIAHSLLEEYYWRWFVFARMRAWTPLGWAMVLSGLGFMAHHVLVIGEFLGGYGLATWFFSACVAVGGMFWAWLYERSQSLYGPWLSHLMIDAALMWVGYDLWRSAAGVG